MRLNVCSMPREEIEHGNAVVEKTESKTKLERPPLYKVLLHNDDFTTMEFVVFVLQTIFNHGEDEALRIMLNVHRQGIGLAGVYTYEVAEMKVESVTNIAQANEFPLLCTMEEDESAGDQT
jgi:ATP-dependent Clp protease adaptor protein ClpS